MCVTFNFTVLFELNQSNLTSTSNSKSMDLFRTRAIMIRLNFEKQHLELLNKETLIASLNLDQILVANLFSFYIDRKKNVRLKLNGNELELDLCQECLEFFLSDFIETSTQMRDDINLIINQVYLNDHRLMLSNGSSKQYKTLNLHMPIEKVSTMTTTSTKYNNKLNKIFISSQTLFSTWNHPTPILILVTILVMIIFALVALTSILVSIYLRRAKRQDQSNSNSIQTTHTSNSSASSLSELTTRIMKHQNENYFQYDTLKCGKRLMKKTDALGSISKAFGSIFKGCGGNNEATLENFNSQANLIMSFHQTSTNTMQSQASLFNVNELYALKDHLNWTPSFELYKSVFNEMETFARMPSSSSKASDECEEKDEAKMSGAILLGNSLVLETNLNKKYGHQTFV